MLFTPHDYQTDGIRFGMDRLTGYLGEGPGRCGLFWDPGLGKTAVTLWLVEQLKLLGETRGVLAFAPKRVCELVWPREAMKWAADVRVSAVVGTATQKLKALHTPADLYVTNPESAPWLATQLDSPHTPTLDWLVLDESHKFKSWKAKRHKALRKVLSHFRMRTLLTGTPSPNGYTDLFGQMYLLDDGRALGKNVTYFRTHYCYQGGFRGREWKVQPERIEAIEAAIGPMIHRCDAEKHLDLPELRHNVIPIRLPGNALAAYKKLERELFVALDSGEDLTASCAGAKYAMCRSVANGGAYYDLGGERKAAHVHDAKVDALADLHEELLGKPMLVAYAFRHDLDRIRSHKRFKKAPAIRGGLNGKETIKLADRWNAGELPVLLCQPQAMAEGLNLQGGGNHVVWFGLTDRSDVFTQFNARVYRQGVKGGVTIHYLLAEDTVDRAMHERMLTKLDDQTTLLEALDRYRSMR